MSSVRLRVQEGAAIVAVVVATWLGLFGAYQTQREFILDLGSPYDGAFVAGFHDREKNAQFTFRWSSPSAQLVIPAVGIAQWIGEVRLATPPVDRPWDVTIDGQRERLGPGIVEVTVAPKTPDFFSGSWSVDLKSAAFRPPADPRVLGVAVDRVVISTRSPIVWPPMVAIILTGLTVAWIYLASRVLRWPQSWAVVASAAGSAVLILLTVLDRPNLYVVWPVFPLMVAIWTWSLGLARFLQSRHWFSSEQRDVDVRLAASALVLEGIAAAAYLFHPQAHIWDATFHVHRLEFVAAGQLSIPVLSTEFGTRPIPYPPVSYIPLLPLFWAGIDAQILIRLGLVASFLALAMTLVSLSSMAGFSVGLSALALVSMPILTMALSWGIYANLVGLGLGYAIFWLLARSRAPWAKTTLLGVASTLSHVSMGIILPLTLVAAGVWRKILGLKGLIQLAIVTAIVLLGSYAAFYFLWTGTMALELRDILVRRTANPTGALVLFAGGSVSDAGAGLSRTRLLVGDARGLPDEPGFRTERVSSSLDAIIKVAKGTYSEARAYLRIWPMLLTPMALTLLVLKRRNPVLAVFLGILSASAVLWAIGVVTGLFVRYFLLAAPAIAILAAGALSSLGARGTAGLITVIGLLLFQVWEAAALWATRLLTVGH
jgi:hypothetical protein